ncbi:hypothetical protein KQ51_01163 [Candidatus Izimaplasma bacterium HR1]|jgi:hypothetical protein|uniref:zinc dependent phospholipase C family protein n=1 Tax=Candidatus Izimoplasma sp. HR1 TaxID=1541959 RepID=UPI0004F8510E|nr:hypothetical protein KQ51_01163 [Candidatus Izimaplasma bacterium HR1]
MADVYLHSRLTEELLKELKSDIDINIAFLGSQGPDPLYYTGGTEYRTIADNIHRYRTRDFFKTMVNYVKDNNNKTTFSFLVGFISHYAMDVFLHPFVYYNVGIYHENIPSTHHMRGLHLKFERTIDCRQIEKELNIPSRKMNLTNKYYPLKEAPQDVLYLMHHTLKQEYKVSNGYTMYDKSSKAMYKTLKYLVTDKTGLKKLFYKLVDLFNKKTDMFMSDLSLFKNTKKYDFHNDSKNIWLHPLTGEEFTSTVEDLFNEAKAFALYIITKVDQYINHNKKVNLDNLFTDLSFNSGKECKLGMDFKYFNIYKK